MIPSDFQKTLIKQIIKKDIYDINSFFLINFPNISEDSEILQIEEFYYKILEYLVIIEELKKENLIFEIDIFKENDISFYQKQIKLPVSFDLSLIKDSKKKTIFNSINRIICQNIKYDFCATPKLEKFEKNNYKTDEEIHKEKSIKYPVRISIITIIISIMVLLVSAYTTYINHKLYKDEYLLKIEPKIEIRPIFDSINFSGVKGIKVINNGENELSNLRVGLSYDFYFLGNNETIKLSNYRRIKVPYDWGLSILTEKLKQNEFIVYNFEVDFIKHILSNLKIVINNYKQLGPEQLFLSFLKIEIKYNRIPDLKEYRERVYFFGEESIITNKNGGTDTSLCIHTTWNDGTYDEYLEKIKYFEGIKD